MDDRTLNIIVEKEEMLANSKIRELDPLLKLEKFVIVSLYDLANVQVPKAENFNNGRGPSHSHWSASIDASSSECWKEPRGLLLITEI